MKDWKNGFNEIVDINQIMQKYEITLSNYRKYIDDLEAKNKVLHKCAYFAHSEITKITPQDESVSLDVAETTKALKEIVKQMEEILANGTDKTTKPTLHSASH
jgi:hypothetical protein